MTECWDCGVIVDDKDKDCWWEISPAVTVSICEDCREKRWTIDMERYAV